MYQWNWDETDTRAYLETDDPRVVAVIEHDDRQATPDGDAYMPAILGHEWWYNERDAAPCTTTFQDDAAWQAVRRAWDAWHYSDDPQDISNRYLRIFHGITLHLVTSTIDQYTHVWLVNSPAWRNNIGLSDEYYALYPEVNEEGYLTRTPAVAALVIREERKLWQAYLDNAVYGVGYAYNPHRVTHETPLNFELLDETFTSSIQCWGIYGEDEAEASAESFEYGKPDLPLMLDL